MTDKQKLALIREISELEVGKVYEISVTPYAPEKDGQIKYAYELRNFTEDYLILDETI